MERADSPTTDGRSFERRIEHHLDKALEADTPEAKNYHIRNALQLRAVAEAPERAERGSE